MRAANPSALNREFTMPNVSPIRPELSVATPASQTIGIARVSQTIIIDSRITIKSFVGSFEKRFANQRGSLVLKFLLLMVPSCFYYS